MEDDGRPAATVRENLPPVRRARPDCVPSTTYLTGGGTRFTPARHQQDRACSCTQSAYRRGRLRVRDVTRQRERRCWRGCDVGEGRGGDDRDDENDGEVQYSPALLHINFCRILFGILNFEHHERNWRPYRSCRRRGCGDDGRRHMFAPLESTARPIWNVVLSI